LDFGQQLLQIQYRRINAGSSLDLILF